MKQNDVLSGFAEKIDFTKLKGSPEDFYKAGQAFIGKAQFDEGILEFVKVIKLAPTNSEVYGLASNELKSLGFSDSDINGKDPLHDEVQSASDSHPDEVRQHDKKGISGGNGFLFGFLAIIVVVLLICTITSGFDGVMFILAFVGGPLFFLLLIIGGLGYYVSEALNKKNNSKG